MRVEQEETTVYKTKSKEQETVSAEDKLQRLGDQCLMLCGFYPEASQEYGVAMDEFISMGSESYKKLASLEQAEDEMIFEYLAENFVQVSELLCYISHFSSNPDKRHVYKAEGHDEELDIPFKQVEKISFSSPISHRVLN